MDEENQNLNTGLDGTQVDNNQTNFNEPVQEAQPSYNGPIQEPQPTYSQPIQNQPVNNQYAQPNNVQYNGQYVPPQQNNQYNPNMNGQYNNQYNQPNQNVSSDQGEKAPTILRIVCFFFPLIGLILYCCNLSSNKTYALSCGKPALAGFITSIVISFLLSLGWIFIWAAVGLSAS